MSGISKDSVKSQTRSKSLREVLEKGGVWDSVDTFFIAEIAKFSWDISRHCQLWISCSAYVQCKLFAGCMPASLKQYIQAPDLTECSMNMKMTQLDGNWIICLFQRITKTTSSQQCNDIFNSQQFHWLSE